MLTRQSDSELPAASVLGLDSGSAWVLSESESSPPSMLSQPESFSVSVFSASELLLAEVSF